MERKREKVAANAVALFLFLFSPQRRPTTAGSAIFVWIWEKGSREKAKQVASSRPFSTEGKTLSLFYVPNTWKDDAFCIFLSLSLSRTYQFGKLVHFGCTLFVSHSCTFKLSHCLSLRSSSSVSQSATDPKKIFSFLSSSTTEEERERKSALTQLWPFLSLSPPSPLLVFSHIYFVRSLKKVPFFTFCRQTEACCSKFKQVPYFTGTTCVFSCGSLFSGRECAKK